MLLMQGGAISGVLVWMGVLVAVTIAGGLVMLAVRRRALSKGGDARSSAGLMESLRQMREEGSITEDEFRLARARLLGVAPPPGVGLPSDETLRAPKGYDLTGARIPPFKGKGDADGRGRGGGGVPGGG